MAPTGVHIRDPRQQLVDAAERLLLREGPAALSSRAVTEEAGVAKGVLHRHFADFDDLLVALVRRRDAQIAAEKVALQSKAGTGEVCPNVARVLPVLVSPSTARLAAVVVVRDELAARLSDGPGMLPPLLSAVDSLDGYLMNERSLGRIAADADTTALAQALVGAAQLLTSGATMPDALGHVVEAVMADVVQRRLL